MNPVSVDLSGFNRSVSKLAVAKKTSLREATDEATRRLAKNLVLAMPPFGRFGSTPAQVKAAQIAHWERRVLANRLKRGSRAHLSKKEAKKYFAAAKKRQGELAAAGGCAALEKAAADAGVPADVYVAETVADAADAASEASAALGGTLGGAAAAVFAGVSALAALYAKKKKGELGNAQTALTAVVAGVEKVKDAYKNGVSTDGASFSASVNTILSDEQVAAGSAAKAAVEKTLAEVKTSAASGEKSCCS